MKITLKESSKASRLYERVGLSKELERLLSERREHRQCVEYGGKPIAPGLLCAPCWREYPKNTNVGEPENGWQWRVGQTKPVYLGAAFIGERFAVFERESHPESIAFCDSVEVARRVVKEHRKRSLRTAENYRGDF